MVALATKSFMNVVEHTSSFYFVVWQLPACYLLALRGNDHHAWMHIQVTGCNVKLKFAFKYICNSVCTLEEFNILVGKFFKNKMCQSSKF